jgi:rubredoxin
MKGVTFGKVCAARRVLNMKRTVAASLLGMSYQQLSKGEAVNSAVPSSNVQSARELIALAQRVRRRPAGLVTGSRPSRLPFERPRCTHCEHILYVVATNYSPRRGEFWYFKCPGCGRRYWSADGRSQPVKPKGGAWRNFKDRIQCPVCQVGCRAAGLRSRRNNSRIWQCPQCRKRYLNLHGHAVESIPGRRAFLPLPFLKSRECPLCGSVRLVIRARPHAPKIRHFYFRCGACTRTFRFDKKLGRLILLQARQVARIKR